MKLLLYCTKAKPYLIYDDFSGDWNDMCVGGEMFATFQYKEELWNPEEDIAKSYNGKVIGECDFEVEEIKLTRYPYCQAVFYETDTLDYGTLLNESRLKEIEIEHYLKNNNGYAIHIKNLWIYDKPRELYELKSPEMFNKFTEDLRQAYIDDAKISERIAEGYADEHECANNVELTYDVEYIAYGLKKAPQNMMYVYDDVEKKVLISIRPEWLCKILNGEKTIEVRKQVLKEMIKK